MRPALATINIPAVCRCQHAPFCLGTSIFTDQMTRTRIICCRGQGAHWCGWRWWRWQAAAIPRTQGAGCQATEGGVTCALIKHLSQLHIHQYSRLKTYFYEVTEKVSHLPSTSGCSHPTPQAEHPWRASSSSRRSAQCRGTCIGAGGTAGAAAAEGQVATQKGGANPADERWWAGRWGDRRGSGYGSQGECATPSGDEADTQVRRA